MNILVTGCGGDIGQSVGKILANYPGIKNLIGADLSTDHPSKFIYSQTTLLPRCDSAGYMEALQELIKTYKIDLVIPVSEAEIRLFYIQKIKEINGIPVVGCNHEPLGIGLDKYSTYLFLKSQNLPFPDTAIVSEVNDFKLPCIVKRRTGAGGKDLHIVRDNTDFIYYKNKYPDFIFQELILPDDEEYTCGLYRSNSGIVKSFILKRKLTGGFTSSGTVVKNEKIEALLNTIAEKADLRGSINVQLRLGPKGPCVFEINPRFSSTVLFRHMLGFKDLIWSVEEAIGNSPDMHVPDVTGKKIYKGYKEYIE